MSGLLVKSTLIMRENLEEINSLGLTDLPVLLGGAALTRRYVERDLREVYEGRLFYGRDAFEGLSTLDSLMAMKRSGEWDPDFGRVPTGRVLPERQVDDDVAVAAARRDRPRSPPTTRCSPRRSSAPGWSRGISLDDIAEFVNETALYRNQWQFRPETGAGGRPSGDRRRVQVAGAVDVPRAARRRQGVRRARAAGGVRLLRRQRRRRRPRRVDRRVAHRRGGPVPLPTPAASSRSCASPTSSVRGAGPTASPVSSTTPRSTSSRWARR